MPNYSPPLLLWPQQERVDGRMNDELLSFKNATVNILMGSSKHGLLSIDSMRVHITPKHSSHLTLLWTVVLRPSSPVGDVNGGWGAQFHNNRDDGSCNFLGCHEMDRPSMDFRHNWNHSVWIPKDQTAHLNWGWWWVWGQPSRGQSASSSSHIGGII